MCCASLETYMKLPPFHKGCMSAEDLEERLRILEYENSELRKELDRLGGRPSGAIAYVLLAVGLSLLILSIIHSVQIAAIIGIAITFWGSLFLFIRPSRFVRREVFNSIIRGGSDNVYQLLEEIEYTGRPRYISPGTLRDIKRVILFISKEREVKTLPVDISMENGIYTKNPEGVKFSPIGLELLLLLEKSLSTNFALVDFRYLENHLGKAIVDELEIARSFEMDVEENIVNVRVSGNVFEVLFEDYGKDNVHLYKVDPLTSALACVMAIVSRKAIIIDLCEWDSESGVLTTSYIMNDL